MTNFYNDNPNGGNGKKLFIIKGQKYTSRYVDRIMYPLDRFEYGFANVILKSGSSIHLPTEESFINFLFNNDWLELDTVN